MYTARINYDAIPTKGFKYVVEINNNEYEAIDFISVLVDDDETIQKELLNFNKQLNK
jgi:hypothetical protein